MFELDGGGGLVDFLAAGAGAFEEAFCEGGFGEGGFGGEDGGFFGKVGGGVEGEGED